MFVTILEKLTEIASGQHGIVSTRQARAEGIAAVELPKLAARGKLVQVFRGVYSVPVISRTMYSEFVEAALWSNGGAVTGESLLLILDLCDVNPRKIHIAVNRPLRRKIPDSYVLHKMKPQELEFDEFNGVRSTTVEIAFKVAIENGTQSRLIRQGLDKAKALGHVGDVSHIRLMSKLYDRDGNQIL